MSKMKSCIAFEDLKDQWLEVWVGGERVNGVIAITLPLHFEWRFSHGILFPVEPTVKTVEILTIDGVMRKHLAADVQFVAHLKSETKTITLDPPTDDFRIVWGAGRCA